MVIVNNGRPELAMTGGAAANFAEVLEWGYHLANTPVGVADGNYKKLWEAQGWKEYVDHMPEHKKVTTAIMLENCRRAFGRLDEVTRTTNLGSFDKWIFPVVANMSENDQIDQLVSIQPMPGPTSQIAYMDIVTEKAKGAVPAGTPFWRAIQGPADRYGDSDELITGETFTTDGAGNLSATLAWTPVRPGTISITVSTASTLDNGNGSITAVAGITSGTVNYATGALTLATSFASTTVTINYAFNSESNTNIQGYEMRLTTVPVTATPIKLRTLWSEEADQNLQAMYNIKMESTMINALTAGLQYQKHRAVIADIRARAQAGSVQWDATPPANVSYQTHKLSIVDAFVTNSNFILSATNMVQATWLTLGLQASTVVETLPTFQAKGDLSNTRGLAYIGDLGGFKVFRDPHYPINEWLAGYKGNEFVTTGYVLAEYQKLYTTPDIVLTDFTHRRAFATSYAKQMVNAGMFSRGSLLNAPVSFGPVIG